MTGAGILGDSCAHGHRVFRISPKNAVLALVVASLPGTGVADRGEGSLSAGAAGNLSFLRCPLLAYDGRQPRLNAATVAIESAFGLGLTDWLEIGLRGRIFLPTNVTDQGVSAQGFPAGDAVYRALALQLPIAITARYSRGGSTSLAFTLETGIEWAQWALQSFSEGSSPARSFDVNAKVDWSTSLVLGLETMAEWRHFDHFSLRLGPRFAATTTGTLHVGVTAGVTFLWGVGVF